MKKTLVFFLFLTLNPAVSAQWHEYHAQVMTTRLSLEFWCEDIAKAKSTGTRILERFEQIEALMSRYIPESELSRVNLLAAKKPLVVSKELFALLEKSLLMSQLSSGAFDITFASVGRYYDYRQKLKPSKKQIIEGLHSLSYQHVVLNNYDQSVYFKAPGVVLDLGGIAKGYAVDEGIKLLRELGVNHARLSAGGDMYLLGDKMTKPWVVAIRDPRDESKNSVVMPLADVALSTSGDYERYFIDEGGERVHHIISPDSGKSASGLMSVSVMGPDTTTTDALSTAVFVLGLEKGMALVNRLEGIDAVFIDDRQEVHYSIGLGRPNK